MKKIITIMATVLALLSISGCDDSLSIVFDDYYVCLKDEYGGATSTITTNGVESYVATYYVNLVSGLLDDALTVNFDVKAGDGLKEGTNYNVITTSGSVTFEKGIYKRPIRIEYFPVKVDESKDCTLTITLTASSNDSVTLGYPGPDAKYSTHVVTLKNN